MAYQNDCSIPCDPERRGQVDSAANELANTAERIAVVLSQLCGQLQPVLSPPVPETCEASDPPAYATPLAGQLQVVDSQLRASEYTIRDLLVRLEV